MQETGITTLECVPYVSGKTSQMNYKKTQRHQKIGDGYVPSCTDSTQSCPGGGEFKLYKASNYTQVGDFWDPARHVESIMRALLQGPVDATFNGKNKRFQSLSITY